MTDLFGNEQIRALSWKEPFATLMLHGKIETRTWATSYRGLILICASKQPYAIKVIKSICGERQFARITELFEKLNIDVSFTCGQAIAVGRLVDCRPMKKEDEDKCFVEYYSDLYCHIYEDVKPIKPFSWKGVQGWKIVEQDIISKIEFL